MKTPEECVELEEKVPIQIVKSGDCWLCDLEEILKKSKNDELLRIVKESAYGKIYLQLCKEHHRRIKTKA